MRNFTLIFCIFWNHCTVWQDGSNIITRQFFEKPAMSGKTGMSYEARHQSCLYHFLVTSVTHYAPRNLSHLHSLSEPQGTLLRLAAVVTLCTMACSLRHCASRVSFSVISFIPISWPVGEGQSTGQTGNLQHTCTLFSLSWKHKKQRKKN